MNLTFLNPFLLFGLAAAILPILIHRITQKKANRRKFAALRLLLQSQLITAKPQRLKHFLLLALRILAVTALVIMMARPVVLRSEALAFLREGAKVVILDNSLSMGYREDRGERYALAKRAAREALAGFDGRVAVIPTVRVPGSAGFQWRKPEEALKFLEAVPLSSGRGDATAAFAAAYRELAGIKSGKEILVVSDLAKSDWAELEPPRLGALPGTEVTFIRMGGPDRDANYCIRDVRLEGSEVVAGVPARLEVTVANLSHQPGAALVQIYLSGRLADRKAIDLNPGQEGKASFELFVEKSGWLDGEVRLNPDRLAADDVFYFPLQVHEKVKVLIVDGDPKTSLKAGESYYLASALNPGGAEGSPFSARVIAESEIGQVNLTRFDVLFLLNVARPDFSRLAAFLETRRPVFIFLGDRVVPAAYNGFPLASWKIQEVIDGSGGAGELTRIDVRQVLPEFLLPLEGSLKNASFPRYYKIGGTAKNLLVLNNLDPLLVEADAGKSRLFLFASSADRDWNDLPLNAAYLPFLQGLVREALGLAGPSLPAGSAAGETFREGGQPRQLAGTPGGTGIFQFRLPAGELRRGRNAPPEESDLAKMTAVELQRKFGALDLKVVSYGPGGIKGVQEGREELWPWLLGLLLALLAVEAIYANGILRRAIGGLLKSSHGHEGGIKIM